MKRREFFRRSEAGIMAMGLPRITWADGGSASPRSFLLEAEQFAEKGGWRVDSPWGGCPDCAGGLILPPLPDFVGKREAKFL